MVSTHLQSSAIYIVCIVTAEPLELSILQMNVKQSILLIFHHTAAMFVNLQCYNVILRILPNTRHEINDTLILVILVK